MKPLMITITFALACAGYSPPAIADSERDSDKFAKEIKMMIAKEHKRRKTDPTPDFEIMHKLCGKSRGWTKGCRFWKGKGGQSKYHFEIRGKRKIYSVPRVFQ